MEGLWSRDNILPKAVHVEYVSGNSLDLSCLSFFLLPTRIQLPLPTRMYNWSLHMLYPSSTLKPRPIHCVNDQIYK